ncbi:MAG: hypothetical protein IJH04_04515 [Eggerthellaceae bacterium]|nr:hypothetical protein [Eggerthellaceae bacterium]
MNTKPMSESDERVSNVLASRSAYEVGSDIAYAGDGADYYAAALPFRTKCIIAGVLVVVALVSVFFLGKLFSSHETYAGTIQALDAKRETVTGLVAASTSSSAAITLLPGDVGTPIAEKLVDLSADFLVVLTAIYLEKYLLTILGFTAFVLLIPIACVLMIVVLFSRRQRISDICKSLALRLGLLGVALFLVVPASVFISGMIESTYDASIQETIATAEATSQAITSSSESSAAASTDDSSDRMVGDDTGATISGIIGLVQETPNNVMALGQAAERSLNNFIEALAVMIVTSCVIPLLVLVFFLWLIKVILGVNVDVPMGKLKPRTLRRMGGK